MLKWFILILIATPMVEMALIIWASTYLGGWSILALIVITGMIGATLAKHQGISTLRRAQANMQNGQLPSEEFIDGICIFFGGILLLAPGFITDTIGLILLFPLTRPIIKNGFKALLQKMMNRGSAIIYRRF